MRMYNVHTVNPRKIVRVQADTKGQALASVRELGYSVPSGRFAVKMYRPDAHPFGEFSCRGSHPRTASVIDAHKYKR